MGKKIRYENLHETLHPSKKIGVALCGGGIRSVAQIGALVALEELGYDIVEVAGTSGGSIIAALYARGYAPSQLISISKGLNWLSLLTLEKKLTDLCKGRKQQIPCRILYTIMNGDTIIDDSHPKAIVRSCNIPGIPAIDGRFMDGCIKHNYPVSVLTTKNKLCFNVIGGVFPDTERNYCKQLSYVNDMYVLQQKPKGTIDLIDYYVDPLKSSDSIYDKLIESGYNKTMEVLGA